MNSLAECRALCCSKVGLSALGFRHKVSDEKYQKQIVGGPFLWLVLACHLLTIGTAMDFEALHPAEVLHEVLPSCGCSTKRWVAVSGSGLKPV